MKNNVISKETTPEEIASCLEGWLNSYHNPVHRGKEVGKSFLEAHRSIQAFIVNFLVSALVAMADGDTDGRNSDAIGTCRKIKRMVDTGEIKYSSYI